MQKQMHLIDVWNVHEGIPVYAEAQRIFNIVGNLRDVTDVSSLSYQLNDGPIIPIFFEQIDARPGRLERTGDFNIDTINTSQLKNHNSLSLIANLHRRGKVVRTLNFPRRRFKNGGQNFRLILEGKYYPEEVGQVVDGHWHISTLPNGKSCLELQTEHAGMDRIILLTDNGLETGYRISTVLNITAWTGNPHNVGIIFKWNPHLQGDGTELPMQWTTSLGYYCCAGRGLTIRTGIDVHVNEQGEKIGSHILGESSLSSWRYWVSCVLRKARIWTRPLPQIVKGRDYGFELLVGHDIHSLTVWEIGQKKPQPQVSIRNPPNLLLSGAAGIIAHRCALRVYDFEVASVKN